MVSDQGSGQDRAVLTTVGKAVRFPHRRVAQRGLVLRIWKFPDQVVRLGILLTAAVIAMVVIRDRFVPESFGELGHYRADAVITIENQRSATPARSSVSSATMSRARSRAPPTIALSLARSATALRPRMPRTTKASFRSSKEIAARPVFPVTNTCPHAPPAFHRSSSGCTIHRSHVSAVTTPTIPHRRRFPDRAQPVTHRSPEPSRSPTTFNCPARPVMRPCPSIFRIPRSFLPKRPTTREFCGGCHGTIADAAPSAPQVDIAAHGDRYLCWQCHYPHFPEG